MTNGDKIRGLDDYELAQWIAGVVFHCSNGLCEYTCPLYRCCRDQEHDNIMDWLCEEEET